MHSKSRLSRFGQWVVFCLIVFVVSCGGGTTNPSTPTQATYTVSVSVGAGTTATPLAQQVQAGQTAVLTVGLLSGYNTLVVTGGNGTLNGNTYTTGPIIANTTIITSATANPIDVNLHAPDALFAVPHSYTGHPSRTDVVPGAHGLAKGGGKVWFLNNGYLQSYDPITGTMRFEITGIGGDILVYEGAPWVISNTDAKCYRNGALTNLDLDYQQNGFINSATSDGAGYLYVVAEGRSGIYNGGQGIGAKLLRIDATSHEIRSYPFRPWTQIDDNRFTSDPYSSIVVDAPNQRAYVLSYYHQDITRINLSDGSVQHFTDSRINLPSILSLDKNGGVVFFQLDGFMRMASDGTFTSRPWPSEFFPSYNGGYWMSGLTQDEYGRTWIVGNGNQLVCMPAGDEGRLYRLTNPGWMYAGWLLWDKGTLWLVNNGALSSAVGNLLEIQVPLSPNLTTPNPPEVTTQPSSVQIGQGQACAFSLVAKGNGILTYQWRLNGVEIPRATSSQFAVPSATGADVGSYTCEITNHLYGKTSTIATRPVTLSLIQDPSIPVFMAEPRRIQNGQTASITAWFSGGAGVITPGGISVSSGVPVNVSPSVSTTYQLTVTNSLGRTVSANLTVNVDSPGGLLSTFSASPTRVSFGQNTTLSWEAGPSVSALTLQDDIGAFGPLDVYGLRERTLTPTRRQRFTLSAASPSGRGTLSVQTAVRGLDRIAGYPGGLGQLDGKGTDALLSYPGSMVAKPDGTLIFADCYDPVIRQVAPDGTVTTLSGCYGQIGDQNGPAATARFTQISGIALASDGTLFILDHGARKLKKLTTRGEVETVMPLGGGGTGLIIEQMTFDASGNLLVPLRFENRVVSVSPLGSVTERVGGITYPKSVVALPDGRIVVLSSFDGTLAIVGTDGKFTVVQPSVAPGDPCDTPAGPVRGMTVDGAGRLFVSTFTGVFLADGSFVLHSLLTSDGNLAASGPFDNIAATSQGFLWASRSDVGAEMYRIDPDQPARRVAGQIRPYAWQGQTPLPDAFNDPNGIALGPEGTIFVADSGLSLIRQISPRGPITTLPLISSVGPTCWAGVWSDACGRIIFSSSNALLRFDSQTGMTTYLVPGGWVSPGLRDGSYGQASIGNVRGLVGDKNGNIYLLDTESEGDSRISMLMVRKLKADGSLVTLAGGRSGFVDGPGSSARFASLRGIDIDPNGNLIVVDEGNHAIRKVTPDGIVTTIAGQAGQGFQDGPVATAKFYWPSGVAVDANGNIFVADTYNSALRMISPDGVVSTIIGNPAQPGVRVGPIGYASLFRPYDVRVNADGDLLITDSGMVLQLTSPIQP